MNITQLAIITAAALAVIIIIALIARKRKESKDRDRTVSATQPVADAPPRGRPDLRVDFADAARQKTEVEDSSAGGAESPLIVGAAQTIGQREDQEDAYRFSEWKNTEALDKKGFMAVMADGIGGLADGQVASLAAVNGAMDTFAMQSSEEDQVSRVLEITAAAQRNVLVEGGKLGTGSGCTFLCALIDDMEMSISSVGDSVIALYRGGVLLQLNREHVLGREIDENNALAGERRVEPPQRRKAITAYLGKHELRTVDRTLRPMQLVSGDRVLLMSDGIFNTLGDSAIIAYLDQEPQAAAEAIVWAVEDRKVPGQDNATIVIIGVK